MPSRLPLTPSQLFAIPPGPLSTIVLALSIPPMEKSTRSDGDDTVYVNVSQPLKTLRSTLQLNRLGKTLFLEANFLFRITF